jgi:hypothetical protein
MPVPRQMTAHTLEAPKGWPSPHAVDFTAPIAAATLAAISGGVVYAGRVVHLNSSGEFELGVDGVQMPLFLFNNSDDPDVENPGGDPATVAGAWVAIAPTGKLMALVAKGAYELASTEFLNTVTYNPNDLLYAPTGTTLATSGVITKTGAGGAYPLTTAVGIVSRGRTTASTNNSHGVAEIYFWPLFLPSHTHA